MVAQGEGNPLREHPNTPFRWLLRRYAAAEVTVRGHRILPAPVTSSPSPALSEPSRRGFTPSPG
jgi:hypothetical protein